MWLKSISLLYVFRLEWPVRTISFSYDGCMLASASEDHLVDIADVHTGKIIGYVYNILFTIVHWFIYLSLK